MYKILHLPTATYLQSYGMNNIHKDWEFNSGVEARRFLSNQKLVYYPICDKVVRQNSCFMGSQQSEPLKVLTEQLEIGRINV